MTATPSASDGAALSGAATRHNSGHPKPPADVAQLRAEIAHTRAELGETVQALAAKADVKARLHESADEAKARMREGLRHVAAEAKAATAEAPQRAQVLAARASEAVRRNPVPLAVAAGAAALIVLFVRWRRSR